MYEYVRESAQLNGMLREMIRCGDGIDCNTVGRHSFERLKARRERYCGAIYSLVFAVLVKEPVRTGIAVNRLELTLRNSILRMLVGVIHALASGLYSLEAVAVPRHVMQLAESAKSFEWRSKQAQRPVLLTALSAGYVAS